MRISRLVQKLVETLQTEGDMNVYVYDELEESTMFVNFGGVRDTSVAKAFYTKGDNCIEQEQEQKVYILRGA